MTKRFSTVGGSVPASRRSGSALSLPSPLRLRSSISLLSMAKAKEEASRQRIKDQEFRPMVVNAMDLSAGRVIGTTITEPSSNEIPAAPEKPCRQVMIGGGLHLWRNVTAREAASRIRNALLLLAMARRCMHGLYLAGRSLAASHARVNSQFKW